MGIRSSLSHRVRHNRWAWRYGFNLASVLAFRRLSPAAEPEARRVAGELRDKGIALSTVERFPELKPLFDELVLAVDGEQARQRAAIDAARAQSASGAGDKTFMYKLLGEKPTFDPPSIYARFALNQALLQSANEYFRMLTRLRYYNVWLTFVGDGAARESQLWHRDRDDLQIVKVFAYLSNVDEGAGPLTYAPRTHLLGKRRSEPEGFNERGVRRSTDEQMEAVVPKDEWIVATGRPGTVVFADTRGYHKGGLARAADRLFYTCMFVSQASQVRELFGSRAERTLPELTAAQSFAVGNSGHDA